MCQLFLVNSQQFIIFTECTVNHVHNILWSSLELHTSKFFYRRAAKVYVYLSLYFYLIHVHKAHHLQAVNCEHPYMVLVANNFKRAIQ